MDGLVEEIVGGEALPVQIVAFRLFGAAVLCACLGLEREWTRHPAGLRTHMLIGLATAIFTLLTLSIVAVYEGADSNVTLDPLRLIQSLGAAIAFIAAGVVVFAKGEIKGLTTSAGIWVAAGIGAAAGLGLWITAGVATVLAVIINYALKPIEKRFEDD